MPSARIWSHVSDALLLDSRSAFDTTRGADTENAFLTEGPADGGMLTDAKVNASPFNSTLLSTSSREWMTAIRLATVSGEASAATALPLAAFFADDPSEQPKVRKTPTPKNPSARVDPVFMTILAV